MAKILPQAPKSLHDTLPMVVYCQYDCAFGTRAVLENKNENRRFLSDQQTLCEDYHALLIIFIVFNSYIYIVNGRGCITRARS